MIEIKIYEDNGKTKARIYEDNHFVKELKEAFNLFKQADEMYPEDLSSKVFMKRCADYIKDGVPEIWDGVYTMTSK